MRRERNQRGAVAVVMALIFCFVMIPLAAVTVDIGMQRVVRRDMQALADVVALDMARQLTGKPFNAYSTSTLNTVLDDSRKRNATNLGMGTAGKSADLSYELGTTNRDKYGQAGYFTPITSGTTAPNAVRVTAKATIGFGFAQALPGKSFDSGSATRQAVAASSSSACFRLGSYAAAINTGDSSLLGPFNKLLGLNLDLVSYKGLAGAGLNLADLAADSHIGSVDTLLGGNVTLGNFTAAAISVLQQQNKPSNSVAISALQAIQVSGVNLSKKVDVLKIIRLQSTDSAALASDFNVLDLVAGALEVANGDHAVDISSLNIAGITGDVKVTEKPKAACGSPNDTVNAAADSSQLQANLNVPLTFPTGNSVLGLTVTGAATVTGGLGNAHGQLVSPPAISCKSGTVADPDGFRVDVNGGLLGLGVQAALKINGTVSTGLLGGLLDSLLGVLAKVEFINVGVTVGSAAPGTSTSTQHADLLVPQNVSTPVKTGSAYGGLGSVPNVTTTTATSGQIKITTTGLLGLGPPTVTVIDLTRGGGVGTLISTLLGTVNTTLNSVLNNTLVPSLNALLTPLAKLLGVNAGGADVYAGLGGTDLTNNRPSCAGSKLAG